MKKITFYIGQFYDSSGTIIAPLELKEMLDRAWRYLIVEHGGFTVSDAIGGYKNETGAYIEPSITLNIYKDGYTLRQVENLGKWLRDNFRQREVLYTIEDAPEVYTI